MMKRLAMAAGVAFMFAAPAFAQDEVTCGDYSLMDNTAKMETVAKIESQTSQMTGGEQLTANQIFDKLEAQCKDKVDVMVIDVVTGK